MKKLLLTGFTPFAGHETNLSQDIAIELNQQVICNYEITSKVLPVSYHQSKAMINGLLITENPDAVICLGIAKERTKITPELIAINHIHSHTCDNDNVIIFDSKINPTGKDAYFSTLKIYDFVKNLMQQGISSEVSSSAGTFVCNLVFYELMQSLHKQNKKIPAGFIHIPTCLQTSIIIKAIKSCISNL